MANCRFTSTGDRKLFERLYDNCADDLYHFMLTQSDRNIAKDICQKTWLKVFEKPHLYNDSGRFIAWLFTIARHALIDEFRKAIRTESNATAIHNMTCTDTPAQDLSQAFDKALLILPFEQREAFCLQQEGFGIQEISDITHSKTETVKSRLRYAKASLRNSLENYHD